MNSTIDTSDQSTALDLSAALGRAADAGFNSICHLRALLYIVDHGNPSITEVAKHTRKSTSALTLAIDVMEKADLIRRVRTDGDRRMIRVEPTFLGREVARQILPPVAA
jgi:DNA-binding MarR family transcriptional regulator